jgi:hypothetical protein
MLQVEASQFLSYVKCPDQESKHAHDHHDLSNKDDCLMGDLQHIPILDIHIYVERSMLVTEQFKIIN